MPANTWVTINEPAGTPVLSGPPPPSLLRPAPFGPDPQITPVLCPVLGRAKPLPTSRPLPLWSPYPGPFWPISDGCTSRSLGLILRAGGLLIFHPVILSLGACSVPSWQSSCSETDFTCFPVDGLFPASSRTEVTFVFPAPQKGTCCEQRVSP